MLVRKPARHVAGAGDWRRRHGGRDLFLSRLPQGKAGRRQPSLTIAGERISRSVLIFGRPV